ncbi:MAG: hypothetical protein ACRD0K_23900 [Egibacteraceae bacterium]
MTEDTFTAARAFIPREARLFEQRLFPTLFEGAPTAGVVDALRGRQNGDGGFGLGHGLEPGKRCPASLPIDVEMAFQALVAAGSAAAADGAAGLRLPRLGGRPRGRRAPRLPGDRGLPPRGALVRSGRTRPRQRHCGSRRPAVPHGGRAPWVGLATAQPRVGHGVRPWSGEASKPSAPRVS